MRRRLFGVVGILAALLLIAAAEPETRLEQYQRLRQEAAAAVKAGDLATAEGKLTTALELYPDVPGSYIRLARVLAAEGKLDKALICVEVYADTGLTYDVAADSALKVLIGRPDFAPIAARMAKNAEPAGGGFSADWALDAEPTFIAEGIVKDGDTWLVSGVASRSILRLSLTATTETGRSGLTSTPYLTPDDDTGALFGMAIDRPRGVLWVAEAWGDGVPGTSGESKAALLKVSLKTGKVLARFFVATDGGKHQLGDVTVAGDGTVYASDGVSGGIYRLRAGSPKLELLVKPGAMASPQGLVICPGDFAMVVADYSTGLHRVNLATGETALISGGSIGLAGTDGMILLNRAPTGDLTLALSQNGVSPQRVVSVSLDGSCSTFRGSRLVAANLPGMDDLTLLAADGDYLMLVSHSRWEARDQEGKLTRPDPGPVRFRRTEWTGWSPVG
ncbi:MAG: hypothetical protein Q7T19_02785 [Caulobacter sp.]|nr:hypothetical protein [Caulobacter sp.]